jgi:Flp pilus assembly protein TadG
MISRLLDWLNSGADRRSVPRESGAGLTAFYWDGAVPRGHVVKDISRHGAYVETGSLSWRQGTVLNLTLQVDPNGTADNHSTNGQSADSPDSIVVMSEVVRTDSGGMGLKFLFFEMEDRRALARFLNHWNPAAFAAKNKPKAMSAGGSVRYGGSLIEFGFLFPLLFLLVVNVINFGTFLYAWITVANAARAGAQYWVTGGATVFAPSTPTSTQVTALVTKDANSLPNRSSLVVQACANNNGTKVPSTCTVTPPLDPENTRYVSATVDVTYTYVPAISLWTFSSLNIHATLPSTTIHRQVVMRVLN